MAQRTTRAVEFERLAALETDDHVVWPYALKVGYGAVCVRGQVEYTHRLALSRRVDMPHDRTYACHRPTLGCSRACMNYRHLYWGTFAENMADMVTDGRSTRGERSVGHVLTESDVREIRVHWAGGSSCAEIGPRYGVSRQCITEIVQGRNWAWLK